MAKFEIEGKEKKTGKPIKAIVHAPDLETAEIAFRKIKKASVSQGKNN